LGTNGSISLLPSGNKKAHIVRFILFLHAYPVDGKAE